MALIFAGCTGSEIEQTTPSPTDTVIVPTDTPADPTVATTTPLEDTATPTIEITPVDGPVIVFSQQGGFAGVDYQWSIYADGRVTNESGEEWQASPEQVAALIDAIEQTGFLELSQPKQEPICCDFFTYTLSVQTADGMHEVTLSDGDPNLPAAFGEALMATQEFIGELTP